MYVFTVPGSPADIKVVVSSPQALFISWLPPVEPNGVITKYNLYTRYVQSLYCIESFLFFFFFSGEIQFLLLVSVQPFDD